jgi:periplasmic protein CpxP/Spy
MKMTLPNRLAPAAVAALLSLPATALAQSGHAAAPVAPQEASPSTAASSAIPEHPVPGKTAAERVERRISELHAQLRITPAEQQQWDRFAGVMRENARDMDQTLIHRAQQFPSMNAVQNMQSYEQMAEIHARHLQKLVPAFQSLYDTMPDQQKRLADQVFRANAEQHAQNATQSHHGHNG